MIKNRTKRCTGLQFRYAPLSRMSLIVRRASEYPNKALGEREIEVRVLVGEDLRVRHQGGPFTLRLYSFAPGAESRPRGRSSLLSGESLCPTLVGAEEESALRGPNRAVRIVLRGLTVPSAVASWI